MLVNSGIPHFPLHLLHFLPPRFPPRLVLCSLRNFIVLAIVLYIIFCTPRYGALSPYSGRGWSESPEVEVPSEFPIIACKVTKDIHVRLANVPGQIATTCVGRLSVELMCI